MVNLTPSSEIQIFIFIFLQANVPIEAIRATCSESQFIINGLQLNNQNIEIHVAVLYPFMVSTEKAEEFLACSHYKIFLT